MFFCFEALQSTKISSYEPVSSQKYENGYRTKICNFTVPYIHVWILMCRMPVHSTVTSQRRISANLHASLSTRSAALKLIHSGWSKIKVHKSFNSATGQSDYLATDRRHVWASFTCCMGKYLKRLKPHLNILSMLRGEIPWKTLGAAFFSFSFFFFYHNEEMFFFFLIRFSSLSPTRTEVLTAESVEKHSAAPPGIKPGSCESCFFRRIQLSMLLSLS